MLRFLLFFTFIAQVCTTKAPTTSPTTTTSCAIDLSHKNLTQVDVKELSKLVTSLVASCTLQKVTTLDLRNNQITWISSGTFDTMTQLDALALVNNNLGSLPNVFDKLTKLTHLDVRRNALTSLPQNGFDSLTQLTVIFISHNKISLGKNSQVFEKLTNLERIWMNNALSKDSQTLPSDLFNKLTKLIVLSADKNQLVSLPANIFDSLTQLTKIDLSYNQLAELPLGVFDSLTRMQKLDIAHNEAKLYCSSPLHSDKQYHGGCRSFFGKAMSSVATVFYGGDSSTAPANTTTDSVGYMSKARLLWNYTPGVSYNTITVNNPAGAAVAVSTCGGHKVFGAQNFGSAASVEIKEFVPAHYSLTINVTWMSLLTWDNERFFMDVDGTEEYNSSLVHHSHHKNGLCCDAPSSCSTKTHNFQVSLRHTTSPFTLKFRSNLFQGAHDESWGLMLVQISIGVGPTTAPTTAPTTTPTTQAPSKAPSKAPSQAPTTAPTPPTASPSTGAPTRAPTARPMDQAAVRTQAAAAAQLISESAPEGAPAAPVLDKLALTGIAANSASCFGRSGGDVTVVGVFLSQIIFLQVDNTTISSWTSTVLRSDLNTASLSFKVPAASSSAKLPLYVNITVKMNTTTGVQVVSRNDLLQYTDRCHSSEFWDSQAGRCRPCPEGGECTCGSVRPKPGYWCESENHAPQKCALAESCPGAVSLKHAASMGQVPKSWSAVCATGYTGQACSSCDKGFVKKGLWCQGCGTDEEATRKLYTVFTGAGIWFFILAVCIAMLTPAKLSKAVNLLVYLQLLALLGNTVQQIGWMKLLVEGLSFLNFDLDLVQPGCVVPVFTFGQYLGFSAGMFAVNLATALLAGLLKAMWERRKGTKIQEISVQRSESPPQQRSSAEQLCQPEGRIVGAKLGWRSQHNSDDSRGNAPIPPPPVPPVSAMPPSSATATGSGASAPPGASDDEKEGGCGSDVASEGEQTLGHGQEKPPQGGGCLKQLKTWLLSSPHKREQIEHHHDFGWATNLKFRSFHTLMIVLTIWFLRISVIAFRGVYCISRSSEEDEVVLHYERAIVCYSGEHATAGTFCWIMLILYSFAFPIAVFFLQRREKRMVEKAQLHLEAHARKDMRLGYLFRGLDIHFFWYPSFTLVFSFGLTLSNAVNSSNTSKVMFGAGCYFLLVKVGVVGFYAPYDKWHKNLRHMFLGLVGACVVQYMLGNLVDQAVAKRVWVVDNTGVQVLLPDPRIASYKALETGFAAVLAVVLLFLFCFYTRCWTLVGKRCKKNSDKQNGKDLSLSQIKRNTTSAASCNDDSEDDCEDLGNFSSVMRARAPNEGVETLPIVVSNFEQQARPIPVADSATQQSSTLAPLSGSIVDSAKEKSSTDIPPSFFNTPLAKIRLTPLTPSSALSTIPKRLPPPIPVMVFSVTKNSSNNSATEKGSTGAPPRSTMPSVPLVPKITLASLPTPPPIPVRGKAGPMVVRATEKRSTDSATENSSTDAPTASTFSAVAKTVVNAQAVERFALVARSAKQIISASRVRNANRPVPKPPMGKTD